MDEAEATLLLQEAVLCGDLARTAAVVLTLPADRRELAFLDTFARVEAVLGDYADEVHAALLLARVVATPDAGAAAADLGEPAAALIDQHVLSLGLSDRIPTWIAEVVWHLGEEISDLTDHRLVTIETLCAGWNLHRPTAPGYLFALASALGAADAHGDGELSDLLMADSGICELVPALLGHSGVGRVMETGSWGPAIANASRAGLIDRDTLLDLSLAHRASDRAEDLHFFLILHEELLPDNAEMSARVDAYERLLADERDQVTASVAYGLYRRDEKSPLPVGLMVAITRAIFATRQEKLITRQVTWLRQAAARNPATAGRLAVALLEGLATADGALLQPGLDAVVAMLADADDDALAALRAPLARVVSTMPADAAALAAECLGPALDRTAVARATSDRAAGERAASERGPGDRAGRRAAHRAPVPAQASSIESTGHDVQNLGNHLPAARNVGVPHSSAHLARAEDQPASFVIPPLPAKVRTLAGLTELAGAYLVDLDPLLGEFVLDALAAIAGADLTATRAALAPLLPAIEDVSWADHAPDSGLWLGEHSILAALARLALPAEHPVHDQQWRVPDGPQGCLTRRTQEVLSRAQAGQTVELLATPTAVTGALDPAVLVERIGTLAQTGSSGWPMDVEQAFLRAHGAEVPTDVIASLSELTTPLALRAERRLRQGVLARPPLRVTLPNLETGTGPSIEVGPAPVRDEDGPLTRQALSLEGTIEAQPGTALLVLMALPHHRELAAAHLMAPLSDPTRRQLMDDLRALALLGAARGRTSDATPLVLLFGAAQRHAADRPAAVSAIESLAVGSFDSEGCGHVWKRTAVMPRLFLGDVAATLAAVELNERTAWLLSHLAGAARAAAEQTGSSAVAPLAALQSAAEALLNTESGDAHPHGDGSAVAVAAH